MRKKLIVGIDPGTTTALALLDLDGNLVDAKQKKSFPLAEITNYLSSQGDPVIIASDVDHSPRLVRKVAATFNAKLFYPKELLPVQRKIEMAGKRFKEVHERDAYAAAISAYRNFQLDLKKISADAEKEGMGDYSDEIKASLLTGAAQNTQSAIEAIKAKRMVVKGEEDYLREIRRKDVEIGHLRNELRNLERVEKSKRTAPSANPEKELQALRRIVGMQDRELSKLKERAAAMEEIISLISGGWIPAKIFRSFREAEKTANPGTLVIILNSDDADENSLKTLERSGAKIICKPNKRIKSSEINYVDIDNVNFQYFENLGAVDGKSIDKETEKSYDREKIEELVEKFKEIRQRE